MNTCIDGLLSYIAQSSSSLRNCNFFDNIYSSINVQIMKKYIKSELQVLTNTFSQNLREWIKYRTTWRSISTPCACIKSFLKINFSQWFIIYFILLLSLFSLVIRFLEMEKSSSNRRVTIEYELKMPPRNTLETHFYCSYHNIVGFFYRISISKRYIKTTSNVLKLLSLCLVFLWDSSKWELFQ